jgi:hypothetical protein
MRIDQHQQQSIEFYWIYHQFQLICLWVSTNQILVILFFVFQALESDDPEHIRVVIEETLSRLTDDTSLNDNTNLLNLISQRKSISTPDISNDQSTFSVSSTEQASSAENLIPSSRTSEQVVHVN